MGPERLASDSHDQVSGDGDARGKRERLARHRAVCAPGRHTEYGERERVLPNDREVAIDVIADVPRTGFRVAHERSPIPHNDRDAVAGAHRFPKPHRDRVDLPHGVILEDDDILIERYCGSPGAGDARDSHEAIQQQRHHRCRHLGDVAEMKCRRPHDCPAWVVDAQIQRHLSERERHVQRALLARCGVRAHSERQCEHKRPETGDHVMLRCRPFLRCTVTEDRSWDSASSLGNHRRLALTALRRTANSRRASAPAWLRSLADAIECGTTPGPGDGSLLHWPGALASPEVTQRDARGHRSASVAS
jgi:hypothetical protein